ncbi:MAG TPA: hypothetical protein VFV67_07500 [Actinophytocola sp.]|uniref:hypothetical protein n=1 Tax=Actinophytocola sp. TaxID=1872138 RepID=UPI002DBA627C|nr:hypothetical protein [Actinophytocola sp.]HEU5470482.1 hypothetical protein [Actinophytocola sp.]
MAVGRATLISSLSVLNSTVGVGVLVAVAVGVVGPVPAVGEVGRQEVVWTATALPLPGGAFFGTVAGTDGVDRFVGWVDTIAGGQHRRGVIWQNEVPTVLGEAFEELTELVAVNTSGVAVGSHFGFDFRRQATRYAGGRFEDLPVPAGAESVATSVNERGDVVGTANGRVIVWPANDPGFYRLLAMPFPTSAFGVSIGVTAPSWHPWSNPTGPEAVAPIGGTEAGSRRSCGGCGKMPNTVR